jgi:hypothetical protein
MVFIDLIECFYFKVKINRLFQGSGIFYLKVDWLASRLQSGSC